VHRSWCAEHAGHESNERLEFLGDSVLGLIVSDHVFQSYPALSEGELTDVRKAVVNSITLAEVAHELDLGTHVLLGKGEQASGGRDKPSILADALEAVIGAIYRARGFDAAADVVIGLLGDRMAAAEADGPGGQDHKSRLQELVARHFQDVPRYEVVADGPDHARTFNVDGIPRGSGQGRSKKQAEQVAARDACAALTAELEAVDA
jgi:ribonuclease-3